jgi:SAM-dependent methyltransferase
MPIKLNNYRLLQRCRLCNSKEINIIHNFTPMPIGNDLKNYKKSSIEARKYPLKLMNCKNCNHFQLSISVKPKILFKKNYTYLTGITKTFKDHFKKYAKVIIKKCNLKKQSLIIDIGSNDGTCLSYFKKNKMKVLGVDPAKLPASIANKRGIYTINRFFNKNTVNFILRKYGPADFITSHNALAHIDNVSEIYNSVYRVLKIKGYFCFEVGYFKEVVRKNLFDTIYHEHLDYYHAKPLVDFLESIGFSIIDLSINNIQGGTLRLLLQKREFVKKRTKKIENFIQNEKKFLKISKIKVKFSKFSKSIISLKKKINNIKKYNNSIYGYGSPTKASLLLISSGLNKNFIKNSFEDNLLKCNKYIPGTDIKIISSKYIKKIKPRNVIILAWNFADEIKLKLKKQNLKNFNLIVPLPIVKESIL